MQTGFVIMLEDDTFGIKYDVDEWTKEDFLTDALNSPIAAIDRGSLYLFGTDELNDGSMITGEVTVSLRDQMRYSVSGTTVRLSEQDAHLQRATVSSTSTA